MEFSKTTTPPQPVNDDLSSEIIKSIDRDPGDIVRCVRVNGSRYRCNWWSATATDAYDNPLMSGSQIGTTHRIRQSRYLDAVRTDTGLQVRVIPDKR